MSFSLLQYRADKTVPRLETPRLILARWQQSDYQSYITLCTDSSSNLFMLTFPSYLDIKNYAIQMSRYLTDNGLGIWPITLRSNRSFIGAIGLYYLEDPSVPQSPFYAIYWHLLSEYWHKGYGYEAAKQVLHFWAKYLEIEDIYALIAKENNDSQVLATRIGMQDTGIHFNYDPTGFNVRYKKHKLYRITKSG